MTHVGWDTERLANAEKRTTVYNNPSRENIDMPDIELLISANRKNIDWELLENYCEIFHMEDVCNTLKGDLK